MTELSTIGTKCAINQEILNENDNSSSPKSIHHQQKQSKGEQFQSEPTTKNVFDSEEQKKTSPRGDEGEKEKVAHNASGTSNSNLDSDTRLWIGNLDARLREFHLLKMVQRFGTIDNFDFLFHRTGPNIGLPRGYAFVTFQDKKAAEDCLKSLDGTKVLDRHVTVRWAHQATTTYTDEETKLKSKLPALSMKKDEATEANSGQTKEKTINAIEEKLKAMEREKQSGESAGPSSNFFYHYNKDQPVATIKSRPRPYERARHSNHGRRPYRR